MNRTRRSSGTGVAAAVLVVGGCGYDRSLNERVYLGGNTPLSSIAPAEAETALEAPATVTTSLAREEWRPIDFVVPVDGTVHGALWRWDARGNRGTARQKALFPTADTALDLGPEGGASVRQAVMQPLISVANVLALPVLVFADAPGNHVSPSRATLYKRSGRGRPVAGTIPADTAP